MNTLRKLLLLVLLMVSTVFSVFAGGDNTIMLEGKPYTLHRVKAGETLYSIAQSAGVDVAELKKVNRLDAPNAAVKADDVIIIPVYSKAANTTKTAASVKDKEATKAPAKEAAPKATGTTVHTVKPGEGLYAIARQYGTSAAAIRTANNLTSDALKAGQTLNIPTADKKTATPEKTAAPAATTKAAPTEKTATPVPTTKAAPTEKTATPVPTTKAAPTEKATPKPVTKTPSTSAADKTAKANEPLADDKVDEKLDLKMMGQLKATFDAESRGKGTVEAVRGVATQMQETGPESQTKFYALSKTSPVGKVLKVRNIMNGRITYVKVIGKLPDNSDNQNVMVKVSGAAAKYLRVLDPKFQCEVTEYK